MADLSDVTAFIAARVAAAVYPESHGNANSVSLLPIMMCFGGMGGVVPAPSIAPPAFGQTAPQDVLIYEGWPIGSQLDLDVSGTMLPPGNPQGAPVPRPNGTRANVSIFPYGDASKAPFQILNQTYVIAEPVLGLAVAIDDEQVTLTGTPNPGEIVTIIVDNQFVYSSNAPTLAEMLSQLLAAIQVNYPQASLDGNELTIPFQVNIVVRQGGVGTLGRVLHRVCQSIMISVWAADHNTRSVLAEAIDIELQKKIIVTLPDTSQAKIVYEFTRQIDELQNVTIYRRDLVFDVEYATIETFQGTSITSVTTNTTIEKMPTPQIFKNVC
jgi:hypothetical protein